MQTSIIYLRHGTNASLGSTTYITNPIMYHNEVDKILVNHDFVIAHYGWHPNSINRIMNTLSIIMFLVMHN